MVDGRHALRAMRSEASIWRSEHPSFVDEDCSRRVQSNSILVFFRNQEPNQVNARSPARMPTRCEQNPQNARNLKENQELFDWNSQVAWV